jgi:hypothetical protein
MSLRDAVVEALSGGPLARKELVNAIKATGYLFKTKNPLNSIGAILYGKKSPVKNQNGKFHLVGHAAPASRGGNNGNGEMRLRKKKRRMSAEAKARISAAQKARWAKVKRGQ